MSDSNYILTWGESENDGIVLHGPFPTERHLTAYGLWWQASHDDDPRWQSVYVADPAKPPRVVTPLKSLWHGDTYGGHSADEYGKPRNRTNDDDEPHILH